VSLRENPVWQLTLVKVREYLREPEAIFWILMFPVLLALALGVAFRSRGPEPVLVGVPQGPGAAALLQALRADPEVRASELPPDSSRIALANGKVSLVVLPGTDGKAPTYWFDPTREESRVARLVVDAALQRAAGRADPVKPGTRELREKGSRYIDFLLPGLLGMNLMGTGMWGIGFAIVVARSKGMLKRLVASPMRRSHFLLSYFFSRSMFLVMELAVLITFGKLMFGGKAVSHRLGIVEIHQHLQRGLAGEAYQTHPARRDIVAPCFGHLRVGIEWKGIGQHRSPARAVLDLLIAACASRLLLRHLPQRDRAVCLTRRRLGRLHQLAGRDRRAARGRIRNGCLQAG